MNKIKALLTEPEVEAAWHSAWRFFIGAAAGLVTNGIVNDHALTIPALGTDIADHWQGYLLAQVLVPTLAALQANLAKPKQP